MPDFPRVQYSQIVDELQTGDLVLFSGATSSGGLIKIFDGAIFSHCGIVRFSLVILHTWSFFWQLCCLFVIDKARYLPLRVVFVKY